jgi:hypothetical protein
LSEHQHPLANDGVPIHEKIDGRFHIGEEYGLLWCEGVWNRMQVGRSTEKMARMRLKGEDQPSLPRLLSR